MRNTGHENYKEIVELVIKDGFFDDKSLDETVAITDFKKSPDRVISWLKTLNTNEIKVVALKAGLSVINRNKKELIPFLINQLVRL